MAEAVYEATPLQKIHCLNHDHGRLFEVELMDVQTGSNHHHHLHLQERVGDMPMLSRVIKEMEMLRLQMQKSRSQTLYPNLILHQLTKVKRWVYRREAWRIGNGHLWSKSQAWLVIVIPLRWI